MIVNSCGGSSGGGGLDLIYFTISVYERVKLTSTGKLAIVTTDASNNSETIMVVPGTSQSFGPKPSTNRTVSFSPNGRTITLPNEISCSVAVFG